MELVSNAIRRIVQKRGKSVDPVIKFYKKSHYGGDPLMYVTSSHKDALNTLTNSKTLVDRHVKALEEMGFIFEEVRQ